MSDEAITCTDCRIDFTFSESEASFFASKGLTKPRRCKPCRQKRKESNALSSGTAVAPSPVAPGRRVTQWVGGGEAEPSSRKDKRRDRRKDSYGDDPGF